MNTPSKALAERTVRRLVQENLLTAAQGGKILPKLAAGTLKAEDWRLALELSDAAKESKQ